MKNKYIKPAFKNYKKFFFIKSRSVTIFGLFVIAALALSLLSSLTYFITIPLIIIPLFLALMIDNFACNINLKNRKSFLQLFPVYFSSNMRGGFKLVFAFLKSILTYLISGFVLTLVLYLAIGVKDQSLVDILEQILKIKNTGELTNLIEFLQENSTYILIMNISEICAVFLGSYIFIHHIFIHAFKYHFNMYQKAIDIKALNALHSFTFKKIRKSFYKDYYSSFWFMIILYIVGYGLGSCLGAFIIKLPFQASTTLGLLIGFILVIYLLPYFLNVYCEMFEKYKFEYLKSIAEIANLEVEKMKAYVKKNSPDNSVNMKEYEETLKKINEFVDENSKDKSIDNKEEKDN